MTKIWSKNTEKVDKNNGLPSTINKTLNLDNSLYETKITKIIDIHIPRWMGFLMMPVATRWIYRSAKIDRKPLEYIVPLPTSGSEQQELVFCLLLEIEFWLRTLSFTLPAVAHINFSNNAYYSKPNGSRDSDATLLQLCLLNFGFQLIPQIFLRRKFRRVKIDGEKKQASIYSWDWNSKGSFFGY